MSQNTTHEYITQQKRRYKRAGKRYKTRLLDEVCTVCGYDRKYASKLLSGSLGLPQAKRGRKPYYNAPGLLKALISIWTVAGEPCGKCLIGEVRGLLRDYDKHHDPLDALCRSQLLDMSPATIDRLLQPEKRRRGRKRNSGTKPGSLLKKQIPVRTDNNDIARPGYLEADTVAHCGGSMSGSFIWSITYTDIHSAWTVQRAVWNKGYAGVLEQTKDVEATLPFPILGFDTDNGGEFLNHHLIRYFVGREHPVGFTRSRSYHKNDQAYVEQKNWTHVRQLLGYDRLDNPAMVKLVNQIYQLWEYRNNYFRATMKLEYKERREGKYYKRYQKAQTPYDRLMADNTIEKSVKNDLKAQYEQLDPYSLKKKMDKLLRKLEKLKIQPTTPPVPLGVPVG